MISLALNIAAFIFLVFIGIICLGLLAGILNAVGEARQSADRSRIEHEKKKMKAARAKEELAALQTLQGETTDDEFTVLESTHGKYALKLMKLYAHEQGTVLDIESHNNADKIFLLPEEIKKILQDILGKQIEGVESIIAKLCEKGLLQTEVISTDEGQRTAYRMTKFGRRFRDLDRTNRPKFEVT